MSKYRTVYAVSSGSYSDYRVLCMFETEDAAKLHAAERDAAESWADCRVEEFRLYADGAPKRVSFWTVDAAVPDDGSEPTFFDPRAATLWEAGDYDDPPSGRPKVRVYRAPAYPGVQRITVKARSVEAARKVAHDRAAELRAKALGLS